VSTDAEIVAAFYPNTKFADQPAAGVEKPQPSEHERAQTEDALRMFPSMRPTEAPKEELADAVGEHRANDPERAMYADAGYYRDELKPADDSPEQAAEVLSWKGILRDVGASPQQVAELKDVLGRELANGLPSEETRAQWATDAAEQLRRQYGEDGAREALADANRMIARDPRLKVWLEKSGLGNHPAYVRAAVELARSQRLAGRLK